MTTSAAYHVLPRGPLTGLPPGARFLLVFVSRPSERWDSEWDTVALAFAQDGSTIVRRPDLDTDTRVSEPNARRWSHGTVVPLLLGTAVRS